MILAKGKDGESRHLQDAGHIPEEEAPHRQARRLQRLEVPVLGADELGQGRGIVDNGGHNLGGGAAVADDDDLFTLERQVLGPARGVEDVALEAVEAGNVGQLGLDELADAAVEELAFVVVDGAAGVVADGDAPALAGLAPFAPLDGRVEGDAARQIVVGGYLL